MYYCAPFLMTENNPVHPSVKKNEEPGSDVLCAVGGNCADSRGIKIASSEVSGRLSSDHSVVC